MLWDLNETMLHSIPDMFASLGADGQGGVVRLSRQSQLRSQDGRFPSMLTAATNSPAGSTSVSMKLTTGLRLTGYVVAGSAITFGLNTYIVSLKADVSSNLLVLELSSATAADVHEGDQATLSSGASFNFSNCLIAYSTLDWKSQEATKVPRFQCVVSIPMLNAPTSPVIDDLLVLPGGHDGRVDRQPIIVNQGFWDCFVVG